VTIAEFFLLHSVYSLNCTPSLLITMPLQEQEDCAGAAAATARLAAMVDNDPVVKSDDEEETAQSGWTRCQRISSLREQGRATKRQCMECIQISDSDDE
jgi:hypothetical protein